jgi:cyclophilin family peptidyl-prolyl cis-trans isomerase
MPSAKRERKREGHRLRQEAIRAARRRESARRGGIGTLVILVIVVGLVALVSAIQGGGGDEAADTTTTTSGPTTTVEGQAAPVPPGETITGETPCPAADGSSPRTSSFAQAPPMCIDPSKTYTAIFDTSEGMIEVALDAARAPQTVNNFVVLARYHYYDGTAVHRTDPSIDIIQGGSPNTQNASDPGPGYTIPDEKCLASSPCKYTEGDLAMARTNAPNSAGAQFFFAGGPNVSGLDAQGTYVTFGKVAAGLDVVKAILGLHQEDPTSGLGGRPSRVVTVRSVTIREE